MSGRRPTCGQGTSRWSSTWDATLVDAHSEKEDETRTWKKVRVPETRLTSCNLLIFVEEAAEAVAPSNVNFPRTPLNNSPAGRRV
jgi:fatty acid-binding protein DegV